MTGLAIKAVDLGKEYKIGGMDDASYNTFREVISNAVGTPFRRVRGLFSGNAYGAAELDESIWALRDVSFEVQKGEVLGIVGHNGAGKSTLLKVLTEITDPSAGYVEIDGRVGSLLEVGTGFHQELTGRENVFLNGAILGMTRQEIDRKYDEIVDFAEVGKFMNTPVKHYSSGMRLRLGFAVAAHLEPEILLIDEVLAVGDAKFQKKCIDKMSNVAQEGHTILFVSHNMSAINQLCQRCILLKQGQIVMDGPTEQVVAQYLSSEDASGVEYTAALDLERDGQFLRVALENPDGDLISETHDTSQPFQLVMDVHLKDSYPNGYITMSMRDVYGNPFLFSDVRDSADATTGLKSGTTRFTIEFPGHLFAPMVSTFTVHIGSGEKPVDTLRNCLRVQFVDVTHQRGSKRLGYFGNQLMWTRQDISELGEAGG